MDKVHELKAKIIEYQKSESYAELEPLFVELITIVRSGNNKKMVGNLLDTLDSIQTELIKPYQKVTPTILADRMRKIVRKIDTDLKDID